MEHFKYTKTEEIVDFLNKQGIKIEKSDIENPKSEIISELYVALFEKLGIFKNDTLFIEFEAHENIFTNPDSTNPVVHLLKIFSKSKKFVKTVLKISDYNSSDIFNPNSKRTKLILGKIIKFYKLKLAEKEFFTQLNEVKLSTEEKLNLLYKEIEENEKKLETLKEEKKDQGEAKQKLKNENSNFQNECMKLQPELISNNQKLKDLTNKIEELKNKIKNNDLVYKDLTGQIVNLQSKIVTSPEKDQNLLDQASSKNQEINQEIDEKNKNIQKIKQIFNSFEMIEKLLSKYIPNLKSLNSINSEINQENIKKNNAKITIDNKTKTYNVVQNKLKNLQNDANSIINFMNEKTKDRNNEKISNEKEIEKYKNELLELEKFFNNEDKKNLEFNKNIENNQKEIEEAHKITGDYEKFFLEQMKELYQLSDEYYNQIKNLLDEVKME